MQVETYVIPKIEDDNIVSYDFEVVLTYLDGTIAGIGNYSVTDNDYVMLIIEDFITDDVNFHNRIRKEILDSGLAEIVGDDFNQKKYFLRQMISVLFQSPVKGAFKRACKLVKDGRYLIISKDEFLERLGVNIYLNDDLDKDARLDIDDVQVYDGIYGSDEFDYEAYIYSDYEDDVVDRNRRR